MLVSVGVPASHSCPHSATKIWNGLYRLWGGGLHTSFGGEDPSKRQEKDTSTTMCRCGRRRHLLLRRLTFSRLLAAISALLSILSPLEKDSFWGDGWPFTTMTIFPMLLIS